MYLEMAKPQKFNKASILLHSHLTVSLGDWLEKKKVTAIIIKQQFGFSIRTLIKVLEIGF
jgi:hypothetical protein